MARQNYSTLLAARPERLFSCFTRLASMTRELKHLTTGGQLNADLMESFGVVPADTPNRPSDTDLLWRIPANDKAIEQTHFVNRAIDIMYFTIDVMQMQIALLQRSDAEVNEGVKQMIRRGIREDGEKYAELESKVNRVLEAQKQDGAPHKENQLNEEDIRPLVTKVHNIFMGIIDDRYVEPPEGQDRDKNYSYVKLKSAIKRASIDTTLSNMFDARLAILDFSIDALEFRMHAGLKDMARYMQWKVLSEANPGLANAPIAMEMKRLLESTEALRPALQSGVNKMFAYFNEIITQDPNTGAFKPVLGRYVVAPASDLPQISP